MINDLKARAIVVDMETGVINNKILQGELKESESQGVREPGSQYCINFVLVYRAHIHSLCNLFLTFFVTFFIDEHINFYSATL